MKTFLLALLAIFMLVLPLAADEPASNPPATATATEPHWKTAYVKRGFVGAYKDDWAKGEGSVLRPRTPLRFSGSKVKVLVNGCYKTDVQLKSLCLIQGANEDGKVVGPHYPILFAGKPGISFTSIEQAWSDEAVVPITAGTWYVQDSYASRQFPYAYDVDVQTDEPKGSGDKEQFTGLIKGSRAGVLTRVDVLTTDPRMSIVCYGDSITHGYGSSPDSGKRYPDQLAKLLGRPVLNLGVNGDVIKYAGGAPGLIGSLQGVDTVVFLMGINDLMTDSVKSVADYTAKASPVIASLKAQHLHVILGTLLPAQGNPNYDKKTPQIETLRLAINTWIRTQSGADGVADFDAAVNDPAHPGHMLEKCQSDWLHPNDEGYARMAKAAASAIEAIK